MKRKFVLDSGSRGLISELSILENQKELCRRIDVVKPSSGPALIFLFVFVLCVVLLVDLIKTGN